MYYIRHKGIESVDSWREGGSVHTHTHTHTHSQTEIDRNTDRQKKHTQPDRKTER